MNREINKIFIHFEKRAEKIDRKTLYQSFVDVGSLLIALQSKNNQVLYGRRGTGKTHALSFLSESLKLSKELPVYVDLRYVGSTGGIYGDQSLPLSERATRLLLDTLGAIHEELAATFTDPQETYDLSVLGPILDELASACSEVAVKGPVERETTTHTESSAKVQESANVNIGIKAATASFEHNNQKTDSEALDVRIKEHGPTTHRVHFGRLTTVLNKLAARLENKSIWILLDEWSVIPPDLQPFLADLLRRSLFPCKSVYVKIAAIEKRSAFKIDLPKGDYIGLELGGDAFADVNMDDFMVFDNDQEKAIGFFKKLIYNHFKAIATSEKSSLNIGNEDELIGHAFSQKNVFRELVKAGEGIPRDTFHILAIAAQNNIDEPITMEKLRRSSKLFYERDKVSAINQNTRASNLLHWIIDKVIAHRKSRAFLLNRNTTNSLVDYLFDSRLLHLVKRNISAHDQPGTRYDAYKIDYGCYVDLLSTAAAPQGTFETEGGFVEVPPDDYRAIRRAILNVSDFESTK